ncbi:antiviral reverse transcriptase Drt2 [Pseudoxanthomonas composti]
MRDRGPPGSALEAALQKKRSYKHFDVPLNSKKCEQLVSDPVAVSRHAFFPFLRLDIVRPRIKRLATGKLQKSNKVRDIRYAAHADAAIYAYYNYVLAELYEQKLSIAGLQEEVIAFRPLGKSNVNFAKEAFDWVASNAPCTALGFDVKDFFGSLDHAFLKSAWAELLGKATLPKDHYAVYRSLTRHASVELIAARKALGISRSALEKRERICEAAEFRSAIRGAGLVHVNSSGRGIPQGSPMSALLSNIYMLAFDKEMSKAARYVGGYYRRYCDDILVIVKAEHVTDFKKFVEDKLANLRLTMQAAKTLECAFTPLADKPLQYLGLVFDGKRILLRSSGVARYYKKMRAGVRQHTKAKTMDGETPLAVQRQKRLLRQYTEHAPEFQRSYPSYVKRVSIAAGSPAIIQQLRRHRRCFKKLMEE